MKYIDLELATLVDMLTEQTNKYSKMLTTGINSEEEFTQCRAQIKQIQEAIQLKSMTFSEKSDAARKQ